ncbi:MAG: InlB B-repeat-containing protein [Oscillospiraceae bacterium]|nr:InlB B-repeat-containing protein [Oscillospiraceae bacterium]
MQTKKNRVLSVLLSLALLVGMLPWTLPVWATGAAVVNLTIGSEATDYDNLADAMKAATSACRNASGDNRKDVTLELLQDVTVSDWKQTYEAYNDSNYKGNPKSLTIDGNGHSISGLTNPFMHCWSYVPVTIRNLTIKEPQIESGTNGIGTNMAAFIGGEGVPGELLLDSCHVNGGSITMGSNAGGLVSIIDSDYAITIRNCSVNQCEISGKSVGGIIGNVNKASNLHISNTTVTGCTLKDNDALEVGFLIGKLTGSTAVTISASESGNTITVESGNLTEREIGESDISVTLAKGGSYSVDPRNSAEINQVSASIQAESGCELVQNSGVWTVCETTQTGGTPASPELPVTPTAGGVASVPVADDDTANAGQGTLTFESFAEAAAYAKAGGRDLLVTLTADLQDEVPEEPYYFTATGDTLKVKLDGHITADELADVWIQKADNGLLEDYDVSHTTANGVTTFGLTSTVGDACSIDLRMAESTCIVNAQSGTQNISVPVYVKSQTGTARFYGVDFNVNYSAAEFSGMTFTKDAAITGGTAYCGAASGSATWTQNVNLVTNAALSATTGGVQVGTLTFTTKAGAADGDNDGYAVITVTDGRLSTTASHTGGANATETAGKNDTLSVPYRFAISYELSGGTLAANNPADYTVLSQSITLNNPTKTGYLFAGWTGSNGNVAQTPLTIASGSTGARSYTAQWTPITYRLVYHANHGTGTIADQTATYDTLPTLSNGTGFTRVGHTLTGWGTTAEQKVYNPGDTLTAAHQPSTQDAVVNLYAIWTPNQYTDTFRFMDGSNQLSSATITRTFGTLSAQDIPSLSVNNATDYGVEETGYQVGEGTAKSAADFVAAYKSAPEAIDVSVALYRKYTVAPNAELANNANTAYSNADYSATIANYDPDHCSYAASITDGSTAYPATVNGSTVTFAKENLANYAAGSTLTVRLTRTLNHLTINVYPFVNNVVLITASGGPAGTALTYKGSQMWKETRIASAETYVILVDISRDENLSHLNCAEIKAALDSGMTTTFGISDAPVRTTTDNTDAGNQIEDAAKEAYNVNLSRTSGLDVSDISLIYNIYMGKYRHTADKQSGVLTSRMQQYLLSDATMTQAGGQYDLTPNLASYANQGQTALIDISDVQAEYTQVYGTNAGS